MMQNRHSGDQRVLTTENEGFAAAGRGAGSISDFLEMTSMLLRIL
jgi:hypothetical protein